MPDKPTSAPAAVLVVPDEAVRTVLEEALRLYKSELTEFKILESMPNDQEKDGIFYVGHDHVLTHESLVKTFSLPLRVGTLIDDLRAYVAQLHTYKKIDIVLGPYSLTPTTLTLKHKQTGQEIFLTERERDILMYLYEQKGHTASRDDLLAHVWSYAKNVETHTLETHMYRLRQKIECDPANPAILLTVDGGYILGD